ncbi:trehalose-6-phosphate synthase [bacterium]|nr:trehalose-6-phosphate synthase [bacterium]
MVNPYDVDACAVALHRALSMPLPERARRQVALLEKIHDRTAARWARCILRDLEAAGSRRPRAKPAMGEAR